MPNMQERTIHENNREEFLKNNKKKGGNFVFTDTTSGGGGIQSQKKIPSLSGMTWAVMSNYNERTNPLNNKLIKDHCGATAATNITLYFAKTKNSSLKKNNSVDATFYELHKRTGNGPVMTIAGDIKNYASTKGSTVKSESVGTSLAYKTAINENRPCGVLLQSGVYFHWIVGVGYTEYNAGQKYMKAVTGWSNSSNKYYLWGNGSSVFSITKYWI